PLPTGITPPPTAADPEIFIGNVIGARGDTVSVPVRLDVTEPGGITVSGFQVAIQYDPTRFSVASTAALGSTFAAANFTGLLTNPAPGILIYNAAAALGTGTLPQGTIADLCTINFTVLPNASLGSSPINLLQNYSTTATAIFDGNLNQLTLNP